jgi:hypothetical protein
MLLKQFLKFMRNYADFVKLCVIMRIMKIMRYYAALCGRIIGLSLALGKLTDGGIGYLFVHVQYHW